MNREFLDPRRKLVDEVADWLCGTGAYDGKGRVRLSPEGARTLDHVQVVVPTAQSGRNLRLAIARRFPGVGVVPPRVVSPMQLVRAADETLREATPCEIAAAFQQYVKTHRTEILKLDRLVRREAFEDLTARFALLDQLEDIWRVLAGRGLLMRDVVPLAGDLLEAAIGDEQSRWQQLGALEGGFFAYLHGHGLAYPTERIQEAKTRAALVEPSVEEIVVPALADPIRVLEDVLMQQEAAGTKLTVLLHVDPSEASAFSAWGVPLTARWTGAAHPVLPRLADADIVSASGVSALVRTVASDFPSAASGVALPALGLCDADLSNGLAAAFLNQGYVVHDPGRHRLVQSSLGRLIKSLMVLHAAETLPWKEFVAFFRSDDVLTALGLFGPTRAQVLAGLDVAQNAYIPAEIPWTATFSDRPDLRAFRKERLQTFCEQAKRVTETIRTAREGATLSAFLRKMLRWTFAGRRLPPGAEGQEFRAAADAARDFLDALEGPFVSALPMTAAERAALARRMLDAAVYSLEPDATDAVRTEGWLELSWSAADRLALVGLHEGKVPDSVVGHPFLPDSLRQRLGLVSNVDRLARDSWLLKELLDSHAPHAVRAYVARATDAGDICRPSRLLYLCADDALASRIGALFGDLPEERTDRVRRVEWPLRLPDALAPVGHYSPSALDAYVKCPFTYLLTNGLGMVPYADKQELEANDFGTLAHAALEAYARRQIANGDDQLTDADAIRRLFREEICPAIRVRFGRMTLNVDLQLRALEGRLDLFAARQAEWARAGWRIRMAEREIPKDLDVPGLGFRIHGYIDRVDENIGEVKKPWCVIDYKTWDKKSLVGRAFTSTSEPQAKMAETMGYPTCREGKTRQAAQRVLSVQLPVYGMCLSALEPKIPFAAIAYAYFVLAATDEECAIQLLSDEVVAASLPTARRAVELIERNVFWPPGPSDEWKWKLKGLFVSDPQADLGGTDWAKAQDRKREACHD